ncbi:SRPBCC family protein [Nocardia farcinica]|uniref:SRPBCC family protein n=1 Tax=Nocardia farcinica TaxID=37329 RepID=UPI0022B9E0A5|nr:SRPBCC family protein [Nocardia farcinica]MCZ9330057.1 SRPBCC family protein [Nocardia farcinica]
MTATRIGKHIDAPRETVYRLLLDGEAVARWMVPDGMTSRVHEFDAREGGAFHITLTYNDPTDTGKTTDHTDSYRGRFLMLVPHEQVVQLVEFDTEDPDVQGEMTISYTLTEADGGTDLIALHDKLPSGLDPHDNEIGWRISLAKLAALAERGTLD